MHAMRSTPSQQALGVHHRQLRPPCMHLASPTCCAVPGSAGTSKLDRSRPLLSARARFFLLVDLRRLMAGDAGATKCSDAPLLCEDSAMQGQEGRPSLAL